VKRTRSETMNAKIEISGKVEGLEKVIKECRLSLPELHDLLSKIDTLFWEEAAKQAKELTE
jgi:hypothetical protein